MSAGIKNPDVIGVSPIQYAATHYAQGEAVVVHAFGHWYKGQVFRTTPTKILVEYESGTGVVRIKRVGPEKVRKFKANEPQKDDRYAFDHPRHQELMLPCCAQGLHSK